MPNPHYPAASMTPEEVPKDVNEAFALVQNLLFDQVHKFHARFGGDKDELTSIAHEYYVKGHAEFVTGKTKSGRPITVPYATSMRTWIWFNLFDAMRDRIKKSDVTEAIGEREFAAPEPEKFDIDEWGFSEDARKVVELITSPPRSVRIPSERKGGTPRNYRSTVREWLTDRGWSAARIAAAFTEIKKALG